MGKICVAICAGTVEEALAEAEKAQQSADIVEIRLDGMSDPAVTPFVERLETPLLFTNRAKWEGGAFQGEETERIGLLKDAIKAGAAYIDIEVKTDAGLRKELLEEAAETETQVIASWHDFTGTPSSQALMTIFQEQFRSGAHIGKIVTAAQRFQDVFRVLQLQEISQEMDFPLIAFCMGKSGIISRVATMELGGYMTYAAPDSGEGTAPGQLPVSELRMILDTIGNAKK